MDSSNILSMIRMPAPDKGGIKSELVPDNKDRIPDKELSFRDVLNSIEKNNDREGREKETDLIEIKNKIDEIEKKIDMLETDGKLSNNNGFMNTTGIESLKSILEEIKKLIASIKNKNPSVDINPGISSISLMSFINQVLEQVINILNNHDSLASHDKIEKLKKALDLIEDPQKAALAQRIIVKTADNQQVKSGGLPLSAEKDVTPKKVVILDNRTKPGENWNDSLKDGKGKKTAGIQLSGSTSIKTESDSVKSSNSQPGKLIENDSGDRSFIKDFSTLQTGKTGTTAQILQVSSNPGSYISRAALETLMQNIAGRALVVLKDGKSELKMNIIPPELGRMSMKFIVEGGRLTGQIVVTTPEAKMIFDQNLGDLQRSLQQAGINIGGLNVSLSGQDSENSAHAPGNPTNTFMSEINEEMPAEEDTAYRSLFESRINYIV